MDNISGNNKLTRNERLRSHNVISDLFNRNSKETFSFLAYPFKVVVLQKQECVESFPEILISVPKRVFKRAVKRNRIKRLTKEAYRTQKRMFTKETYIALLFIGKEIPALKDTEKAIAALFRKMPEGCGLLAAKSGNSEEPKQE